MKIREITDLHEGLALFPRWDAPKQSGIRQHAYKTYLPETLLIKYYKQEFNVHLAKSKINVLLKDGLIESGKVNGVNWFPLNTAWRIGFIEKFRKRFKYPLPILQQIITYENIEIFKLISTEFYEKTFNPLPWGLKILTENVESGEHEAEATGEDDQSYLDTLRDMRKQVNRISRKKRWNDLSNEDKKAIECELSQTRSNEENKIREFTTNYYDLILKDFSPQIVFKKTKDEFDLKEILKRIKKDDYINYFSTPDFNMIYDNENLIINIINTKAVKSSKMREIGIIYTAFVERLEIPREPWGSNSGSRLLFNTRQEGCRNLYFKIKEEKPHLSADQIIDKHLRKYCRDIGLSTSHERIRRIVHTRPK